MPCLCDIFVSAILAFCAVQTSLRAAAVLFFYDVAAFVLFNFAARAFFHVISCVAFIDLICKIVLCVGVSKIAALCAFFGATANKLVYCILRAFVKSRGNAWASRVGTFCVAVMLEIYLLDFFNPGMLVSARYVCNRDGDIASLSVRCRCGDVHRSAVHCVFCDYLIVTIRFVKNGARLNFHSYWRNFCLIGIRTGCAAKPYTRIGIFCGDFARHLFVDSGRYVSRITDIRHSSGNEKIHFYCRCSVVLSCAVPKFYILAFAEFRTRHFHMAFKHVCLFGQLIVFFRRKKDANAIRDFLLNRLVFNPAPRKRRTVFFP